MANEKREKLGVANREKHVTADQVRMVWRWLRENPELGNLGLIVLRGKLQEKFRAAGISMGGLHVEALLDVAIREGWLTKEAGKGKNGRLKVVVVAVDRPEEKPVEEPPKEEPEQAELPLSPPVQAPCELLPSEAESLVVLCRAVTLNEERYLLRADVLDVIRLMAEERDQGRAALEAYAALADSLHSREEEVEELERKVEALRTEKNEDSMQLAKARMKITELTSALDKADRACQALQREKEKVKPQQAETGRRLTLLPTEVTMRSGVKHGDLVLSFELRRDSNLDLVDELSRAVMFRRMVTVLP